MAVNRLRERNGQASSSFLLSRSALAGVLLIRSFRSPSALADLFLEMPVLHGDSRYHYGCRGSAGEDSAEVVQARAENSGAIIILLMGSRGKECDGPGMRRLASEACLPIKTASGNSVLFVSEFPEAFCISFSRYEPVACFSWEYSCAKRSLLLDYTYIADNTSGVAASICCCDSKNQCIAYIEASGTNF